jgi:hypothetical protein
MLHTPGSGQIPTRGDDGFVADTAAGVAFGCLNDYDHRIMTMIMELRNVAVWMKFTVQVGWT